MITFYHFQLTIWAPVVEDCVTVTWPQCTVSIVTFTTPIIRTSRIMTQDVDGWEKWLKIQFQLNILAFMTFDKEIVLLI